VLEEAALRQLMAELELLRELEVINKRLEILGKIHAEHRCSDEPCDDKGLSVHHSRTIP
jgi:hypothetical protein